MSNLLLQSSWMIKGKIVYLLRAMGEGGVRDSRVVLEGHTKRCGGGMIWGRQVLELVHPELRAGVFIHCLLPAIRKTEIHWHR